MIIYLNNKDVTSLKNYLISNNILFDIVDEKRVLCIGSSFTNVEEKIRTFDCVDHVEIINTPFKYASKQLKKENSVVSVGKYKIGGDQKVIFIGGPCSIENHDSIFKIAEGVKNAGANILRGGAYKPRTSPYSFQGLKSEGILELLEVKKTFKMPIISEILSTDKIEEFNNVDIIQVGARNMQNYELLKALGKTNKVILLKRGLSATIEEWLMAAEYILSEGNPNVILCERGIRTFENATRNTLDLSAIPYVKSISHLPIIVDPSHATGKRELIESMSLAAIAAGADGIMLEVHTSPSNAWSDQNQCISVDEYEEIVKKCKKIAKAIGRKTY